MSDDLEYTVGFEFIPEGIRLRGKKYPMLKMEWVQVTNLCEYVRKNLSNRDNIASLSERFRLMMQLIQNAGIAHGDLQHGNILINADGGIRLVDYDCMYVPGLSGWPSNELGHRNYQHPGRAAIHFSPEMDNFSAWSIDTSLRCLAIDPGLWDKLKAGDECLLFRRNDFVAPATSEAFHTLASHGNEEIVSRAQFLQALAIRELSAVPYL